VIHDRFKLADGRIVIFDELKEQDLPEIVPVFNSVVQEGLYFHRNEGLPNVETARKWFQDHVKVGMIYVAARVNNELVGGATIEPKQGKASHRAYFGIYLKKEFRNMGIGTRLISKIIEIARQMKFETIELTVFALNQRALHIYSKFGFQEVGRIKDGIKFLDGTYTDEIIMTLFLKERT